MTPLSSFPSFPSSAESPGQRCLEILRSLQKEKTHTSERSPETETTTHRENDRNDENDQSPRVPDPAVVARLLGLPLLPDFHAAGQMLEVRVAWLHVSLWFVPDEAAVEMLLAEGVSRGRVWTAHELVDLLRTPGLTSAGVQTVATAKLEFLGEVVRVALPPPVQATLPGLEGEP